MIAGSRVKDCEAVVRDFENQSASLVLLRSAKHVYPEFVQWIAPSEKDAAMTHLRNVYGKPPIISAAN